MVSALKGNTLVLYQLVEKHGEMLYNMLKSALSDNRIRFVHGKVKTDVREVIRETAERVNDLVIVASYGTYSTGINIKNLHNIVFASPSKSRIRNLQSIGRGLRRSDTKDNVKLFDISGLGIAFRAQDIVKDLATTTLEEKDLTKIIPIINKHYKLELALQTA